MRTLNAILMLLGAVSVLMLGAVPASATMRATAACHEAAMSHEAPSPAPASDHGPKKAMTAMACCVSCVTAPMIQPPMRGLTEHAKAPNAPAPVALPSGLSLAPETGPPKG